MYELAGRESKNKSEKHMSELFHIPIKIYNIYQANHNASKRTSPSTYDSSTVYLIPITFWTFCNYFITIALILRLT